MFKIRGKLDGKPAHFTWIGPDDWSTDSPALEAELALLLGGDEPVEPTPEGPSFDPGFEEEGQAYATAVTALDGDLVEVVEGGVASFPRPKEDPA